jgi:uncharacterized protein
MTIVWSAFLIGFWGSLHCVGMCGPIVLALPAYTGEYRKLLAGRILYNLGRVVTYSIMGGILGIIGYGIALAGFQQWFSIFLGAVVLLFLFYPRLTLLLNASHPINLFNQKLKNFFGQMLRKKSLLSQYLIGMANGLLPCGLVYVALAGAIVSGTFAAGALYMALFGLGTFPLMLAISFSGNFIGLQLKKRLYRFTPIFIVAIALIFILRGLNLGIPYVSPKVDKGNVGVEMCH